MAFSITYDRVKRAQARQVEFSTYKTSEQEQLLVAEKQLTTYGKDKN